MNTSTTPNAIPRIEDDGHRLRVEMRAQRVRALVAFVGLWCVGWAYGEWTAITSLLRELPALNLASLLVGVWLIAWTMAGVAVVAMLAFLWDGREIVTVDDSTIVLRAEALGRGLDRTYDLQRVANLRPVSARADNTHEFLAFDYSGRTVRFGTALDDENARRVAREITARWPHLSPDGFRR